MEFIEIIKAAVLAIVQGLTEFLPISSSGHLAISNALLEPGFDMEQFTIMVHFGTMMATVWVFWDDIVELLKSLGTIPNAIKTKKADPNLKIVFYIIVATIPTLIAGFFLKPHFESLMGNVLLVGIMMLVTGGILLATKFVGEKLHSAETFGGWRALVLGIAQSLAIMPGISRSGTTISTALFMKSKRKFAGRISFLISLPAIIGATILEYIEMLGSGVCPFAEGKFIVLTGLLVSFLVGLLALKLLLKLVEKGKFYYFSFYLFVVGSLVIVLSLTGVLKSDDLQSSGMVAPTGIEADLEGMPSTNQIPEIGED